MPVTDPHLSWDDPAWREASDTAWQRALRRHQAWWRQERLALPAGPISHGQRLVASMLPAGTGLRPNLMTDEAVASAEAAIADLKASKRPGLIQQDRLERNLLSSQPLCFNLFGHLAATPEALLPWVRSLCPAAAQVLDVRLEWAPEHGNTGGSAFDAFVEYVTDSGARGFLGVECKYAENLAQAQPKPAADKYVSETRAGAWIAGASDRLDKPRLRQFWYNQLLAQRVLRDAGFSEGVGVVVACSDDQPAREAVQLVAAELKDRDSFVFSPLEDVVNSVTGHDEWRLAFTERHLDRRG